MGNIFDLLFNKYELFLLILVRTSGIFFISPFFSSQNVPNTMKIGLTLLLSSILTFTLEINPEIQGSLLVVLIIKELMVGIIIGFISYLFFSTFYVMGQIVDMNIGFGMVNVIDPQNRIQVPLMGNFYYILAFLLLLSVNGHHVIINALVDSYEYIPIGVFKFKMDIGYFILDIVSQIFTTGFKLSVPVVAIIFLLDLLLGVLVRTIPQMNVFVVGLPLKIIIGMTIILLSIPIFSAITMNSFNNIVEEIYNFLRFFGKG